MKKHYLHFQIVTTMLIFGLGMGSCCKEQCHDPQNPECENYDPCWGRSIENGILISRAGWGGVTNWFQPDIKIFKG